MFYSSHIFFKRSLGERGKISDIIFHESLPTEEPAYVMTSLQQVGQLHKRVSFLSLAHS